MKTYGIVAKLRATVSSVADGVNQILRQNQLGEVLTKTIDQDQFALEGSYFTANNATIGTAVALGVAAATTFSATAPALLIRNTDVAGGKDLLLKKLSLMAVGVNTAGTELNCAVVVDSTNRLTSGGLAATIVNLRADSAVGSIALLFSATTAVVASAAGVTARLAMRTKLRIAINVLGDIYRLCFGSAPASETGNLAGTTAQLFAHGAPPIVVPPGGSALIYLWSAAQTAAPTYEWQLEWAER